MERGIIMRDDYLALKDTFTGEILSVGINTTQAATLKIAMIKKLMLRMKNYYESLPDKELAHALMAEIVRSQNRWWR